MQYVRSCLAFAYCAFLPLQGCDGRLGYLTPDAQYLDPVLEDSFQVTSRTRVRVCASLCDAEELALAKQLEGNLYVFSLVVYPSSGFKHGVFRFL